MLKESLHGCMLKLSSCNGRTRQGVGCVKRRPTSEETPFEGGFRPDVRRRRRALVEVQATGGCNLIGQPVGRREVGFGYGRGSSQVADLDPTPVHVGQLDLSAQSLEDDFRQPAHDLLGLTSQREVA